MLTDPTEENLGMNVIEMRTKAEQQFEAGLRRLGFGPLEYDGHLDAHCAEHEGTGTLAWMRKASYMPKGKQHTDFAVIKLEWSDDFTSWQMPEDWDLAGGVALCDKEVDSVLAGLTKLMMGEAVTYDVFREADGTEVCMHKERFKMHYDFRHVPFDEIVAASGL